MGSFGMPDPFHTSSPKTRLVKRLNETTVVAAVAKRWQLRGAVTLDLKLTYPRPLSVRSGTISAEGKVVELGRQTSYAEVLPVTHQAILRCTQARLSR
jgi:uncharacterized protein (TIGR00369 family)